MPNNTSGKPNPPDAVLVVGKPPVIIRVSRTISYLVRPSPEIQKAMRAVRTVEEALDVPAFMAEGSAMFESMRRAATLEATGQDKSPEFKRGEFGARWHFGKWHILFTFHFRLVPDFEAQFRRQK